MTSDVCKVLVIDDEPTVRRSIAECLCVQQQPALELMDVSTALFGGQPHQTDRKTIEFQVTEVSNGKEGAALLKAELSAQRPFTMVFLDYRMPGWDGLATAKALREVDSNIEIIFVSAFTDVSPWEISMEIGCNHTFLCKPFDSREILQLALKADFDRRRQSLVERLRQALDLDSPTTKSITSIDQLLPLSKSLLLVLELLRRCGRKIALDHLHAITYMLECSNMVVNGKSLVEGPIIVQNGVPVFLKIAEALEGVASLDPLQIEGLEAVQKEISKEELSIIDLVAEAYGSVLLEEFMRSFKEDAAIQESVQHGSPVDRKQIRLIYTKLFYG